MSVFPKKLSKGENVIIHLGVTSSRSNISFATFHTYIVTPQGNKISVCEKYIISGLNCDNTTVEALKEEKYRYPPLVVVSDLLSGRNTRQKLIEAFTSFDRMTHFYFCLDTTDLSPGKYLVRTEFFEEGIQIEARTNKDDFFLVEELQIRKISIEKDILNFSVENKSPESCTFSMFLYNVISKDKKNISKTLDGYETICFSFPYKKELCVISYSEGRKVHDVSRFLIGNKRLIRNPKLFSKMKMKGGEKKFYIFSSTDDLAYILDDVLSIQIWEKVGNLAYAIDFTSDERIILSELMDEGLILEI